MGTGTHRQIFQGTTLRKKYVPTILLPWVNLTKNQISGEESTTDLGWVMCQLLGELMRIGEIGHLNSLTHEDYLLPKRELQY